MKIKYKNFVPLVLIGLMALAWYQLNSKVMAKQNEYGKYVAEARRYSELGVTTYAQKNYMEALKIRDSIDLRFELADCYKKYGDTDNYVKWCQKIQEKYPTDVRIYERLAEAYYQLKDYASCYDTITLAKKRRLFSNNISDVESKMAYEYTFAYNSYEDVSCFMEDYCAVKSKDCWGFVNFKGKVDVSCNYKKVSSFSDGYASVVDQDNSIYFIDTDGNKAIATKDTEYTEFGLISDGVMTAVSGGKYMYLDKSFKKLFGDYDFASAMNIVAAVKSGNDWEIIDGNGKSIGGRKYQDVIIDENGYACRKNRLFANTGEGYVMLDSEGNMVSNQVYEDAKLFSFGTLAAVKLGGKWGYVDQKGNMVIEPQYEDARSFSYGIAAVKVYDKWGFIDEKGEMKINAEFYDSKDFCKEGSCFVKVGDTWQLLKLFRNLSNEG